MSIQKPLTPKQKKQAAAERKRWAKLTPKQKQQQTQWSPQSFPIKKAKPRKTKK